MNKVILIGRLGKDPELTYTQSGTAKCKFSLATSRRWRSKDGEKQEKTAWHNVVVWGEQAKTCAEFLAKGNMACVEGEIEYREWDKGDGQKGYMTEINAAHVEFLTPKGEGGSRGGQATGGQRSTGRQQPAAPPSDAQPPWDDSDIPF